LIITTQSDGDFKYYMILFFDGTGFTVSGEIVSGKRMLDDELHL
jgi:hypothetical protein